MKHRHADFMLFRRVKVIPILVFLPSTIVERYCFHKRVSRIWFMGCIHSPGRHPLSGRHTAAHGTHPTGMHSCFFLHSQCFIVKRSQNVVPKPASK